MNQRLSAFGSLGSVAAILCAWSLVGGETNPVRYLPSAKTWILQGTESQYALKEMSNGALVHLWWCGTLSAADYETGVVAPESNQTGWGENSRYLEFPAVGEWRHLEPALKVEFADGVRDVHLKVQSQQIGGDQLTLTLVDTHYPLEVKLHYRVFPQQDLIERRATITNRGQSPIKLEQALSGVWHLPRVQDWTLTYLGGKWGGETQVREVRLDQGKFQIESRHGATSHSLNPWFAVSQVGAAGEEYGEVWFGALGWSGSWKICAELNAAGRLQIAGGIHDFDFAWNLKPGESFEVPAFVGGYSAHGFGQASRQLHRYELAQVIPKPQAQELRPILYNSWYATEFNINVQQQIDLAKQARDLGVELFVIDDGWFGKRDGDKAGLGDWVPSKTKFPQGMKPLISAVHEQGMKFGLWVEPEMVNADSDLYRAHPDWIFQYPTRPKSEQRNQLMLNFAKPEAKAHILEMLDTLLRENEIDFIKWDMNRHIMEAGWVEAPREQQREMWVRHTRAVYEILDTLRTRHPKVLWETCSGGGGRVDLGILSRTDQAWTSDNTDPLDRLRIQEGFTYAYAPKVQVGWVTDNPDGLNNRSTSLAFRFHTSMMGTLGVGGNLLKWSDQDKQLTKWFLAEYKQIRQLVQEGDLYRLRSPRDPSGFSVVEYADPKGQGAVVFVFLHSSHWYQELPSVPLRGLNPKAVYRVESRQPLGNPAFASYQASGEMLMNRGLSPRLRGDFVSQLIRVTRVEDVNGGGVR